MAEEFSIKFDVKVKQDQSGDLLVSFTEDPKDFTSVKKISNGVLENFLLFRGLNGNAYNYSSFDLNLDSVHEFYNEMNQDSLSMLTFLIFEELDSGGELYMNGVHLGNPNFSSKMKDWSKDMQEYMHKGQDEIIEYNKTSDEILRVFMSNMYMGMPF